MAAINADSPIYGLKGQAAEPKVETLRTLGTHRTALYERMDRCHSALTTYLATAM